MSQELAPFRYNTRRRYARVPVLTGSAPAAGTSFHAELPKVGFLSAINLRIAGTANFLLAGAEAGRGVFDFIKEMSVRVNMGAATIYRTSGHGCHQLFAMSKRGVVGGNGTDALYNTPFVAGDNDWWLTYRIPIAVNDGNQFDVGLINLQAPEIQVSLEGQYLAALTDIATNFNTFAGSLEVGYEYYEVPNPYKVAFPPMVFHRVIETQQQMAAVGDQTYLVPREGQLLRMGHFVFNGAAWASPGDLGDFRLVANRADTLVQKRPWEMHLDYVNATSNDINTGHYWHEFYAANGQPGEGDSRDVIDAEAISQLESVFEFKTALGAAHYFDTVREFLQVVTV
jgi:hypothetical protein